MFRVTSPFRQRINKSGNTVYVCLRRLRVTSVVRLIALLSSCLSQVAYPQTPPQVTIQQTLGSHSPTVTNAGIVNIITVTQPLEQRAQSAGADAETRSANKPLPALRRVNTSSPFADALKRAKTGDRNAQLQLAWMYENGRGVERDETQALAWFLQSAAAGHPEAQFNAGFYYYAGRAVRQNYAEALHWFRRSADAGNSSAQAYLGIMNTLGQGIRVDHVEATRWLNKSASAGNPLGQFNLAVMFDHGKGVAIDRRRAADLYRKASDGGITTALVNLGYLYEHGLDVSKNPALAFEYYSKAADANNLIAITNVALCHLNGIGTAKNREAAIAQLWRAGELGSSRAFRILSDLYIADIPRADWARAEEVLLRAYQLGDLDALRDVAFMYRRFEVQLTGTKLEDLRRLLEVAAGRGEAPAMLGLAAMYESARFYKLDLERKRYWLSKAADRDYVDALVPYAQMVEQGDGGPKDVSLAIELWGRAAQIGNRDAQLAIAQRQISGQGLPRNTQEGERKLRELLSGGFEVARLALAGKIVSGDLIDSAIDPIQVATEFYAKGNTSAAKLLGVIYDDGKLVRRNVREAIAWYDRAAMTGDVEASLRIARLLLVDPDLADQRMAGVSRLEELERKGNALAAGLLGLLYFEGKLTPQDLQKAEVLLRRALTNPDKDYRAIFESTLGATLLFQEPTRSEAFRLLESSAASGNDFANFLFGVMYELGDKLPKDGFRARAYYARASDQGNLYARLRLAKMLARGEGGQADPVSATKLLSSIPPTELLQLERIDRVDRSAP